MTQVVEKQVQIGTQTVLYRVGGNAASAPILLLHGWGISSQPYQEVLEILAQNHAVIAPDLPGCGGSSPPQFLDRYSSYAELLINFIDTLKIPKIHLVGHSLGGGISLAISALVPDRIASLTLVDSTGIPCGSVPEVLMRRAIEMPLQISIPKLKLQLIDIPQAFFPNLLFRLENLVQALLLSLEQDGRSLLSHIQAPCLVLNTAKDLTTPLSSARELTQRISNAKLMIIEEGFHEWCLLYPEKFTAIVSDFVKAIERR